MHERKEVGGAKNKQGSDNGGLTVSNSGLPRHLLIDSKNRSIARSSGSVGYCQEISSRWVDRSGHVG